MINNGLHIPDRFFQTGENRTGDNGMSNIQFVNAMDRRYPLGVVIMQAVAGIDDKPFLRA